MKITIGMASLADIAEKACKAYRKKLAEAEFMCDIRYIVESLADTMRLWEATEDNFDCNDELVLTIGRSKRNENGKHNKNVESGC